MQNKKKFLKAFLLSTFVLPQIFFLLFTISVDLSTLLTPKIVSAVTCSRYFMFWGNSTVRGREYDFDETDVPTIQTVNDSITLQPSIGWGPEKDDIASPDCVSGLTDKDKIYLVAYTNIGGSIVDVCRSGELPLPNKNRANNFESSFECTFTLASKGIQGHSSAEKPYFAIAAKRVGSNALLIPAKRAFVTLPFAVVASNPPSGSAGSANTKPAEKVQTNTEPASPSTQVNPVAPDDAENSIGKILCVPEKNSDGNDLYICINRLYKFTLAIGGIGAVAMIVVAGYLYMTGNHEQIGTAKSMISTSFIGIGVFAASYVFLKMINPSIVEFRPITPPLNRNVAELTSPEEYNAQWCKDFPQTCYNGKPVSEGSSGGSGSEKSRGGVTKGDGTKPGPGQSANELKTLGCIFDSGVEGEVAKITNSLYLALKTLCSTAGVPGAEKPRISSLTGGKHTDGSLHYDGCAADFGNDTYTSTGKKIIDIASNTLKMVVNPGSDANQTYHIHVSIGNHCGKGDGVSAGPTPGAGGLTEEQLKPYQAAFEAEVKGPMKAVGLNIQLRSQWGANPLPNVAAVVERNPTPTYVVIHHTADIDGSTASTIKSIERFQVEDKKFADVAYHFLIASNGTIYQGRYGGMEIKGAHFHENNDGNIGIAMIGNFNNAEVTNAAKDSLIKLLSYIKTKYSINYKGSSYVAKINSRIPNLAKHSDINGLTPDKFTTECPGRNLTLVINQVANQLGLKQEGDGGDELVFSSSNSYLQKFSPTIFN